MGGKKLGELLVEKGLITAGQLEGALEKQRSSREFLGAILIAEGWVSEEGLLRVLADQFEMPFIRLTAEMVDWDAAMRFARPSLLDRGCFPLRMDARQITMAMSNPLDMAVMSDVEQELNPIKVRWVLMPAADIQSATRELRNRIRGSVGGGG
ncbi:MAG: hypothetical protein HYZ94_02660 [Candidatus Omnitrophica bacterium]|nr:hypothetical protein [Candidatus Omnitrophota bacterium]